MEDNSFLYFTQDEVISKMNIDPRLVDSFKRVMKTMQEYFNANGYTEKRNYKEYIEKYFITSGENNMKIYVDKIDDSLTAGFYSKSKNAICINEEMLNRKEEALDHTLCHEFIHFLVMHSLTKENSEPEIYNGGFINEALTEMLAMQMYNYDNSYEPQVKMHKFVNLLSGNVNNYRLFLEGKIDAKYHHSTWDNYRSNVDRFQRDFNEKGYLSLFEAKSNENYIKAQRDIIYLFINTHLIKTFDEYLNSIKLLIQRPVDDSEFIEKFIDSIDKSLIHNLWVYDQKIFSKLKDKLSDIRNLIMESTKYDGKEVYEFEFDGRIIAIDKNLKLYGNISNLQWNYSSMTPREKMPKEIVLETTSLNNRKKYVLDYKNIDFTAREKKIQEKIREISSVFTKKFNDETKKIIEALSYSGELIKVEEFILPEINYDSERKNSGKIYIATFTDKVILLDNNRQIKEISNFDLNEFTGWDTEYHGVWGTRLGKIEKGTVFTALKDGIIKDHSISKLFKKDFEKNLNREELESEIHNIELIEENAELTKEQIEEEAFYTLLEKKYDELPKEVKEKYNKAIIDMSDKFVVYKNNDELDVGLYTEWTNYICVYKAKSRVLFDAKGKGIYNDFYDVLNEMVKEKRDTVNDLNRINNNPNNQQNNNDVSPSHEETSDINDFYELFDTVYIERLKDEYRDENDYYLYEDDEKDEIDKKLDEYYDNVRRKNKEQGIIAYKEAKDQLWNIVKNKVKENPEYDLKKFIEYMLDNYDVFEEQEEKIDEVEPVEGPGRGFM